MEGSSDRNPLIKEFMVQKAPPPPPAGALDEGPAKSRKENFSMIKGDLGALAGLDDPRINLIGEFIHLVVENKDKPLGENEVRLLRGMMRLILKDGGRDFLQTLSEAKRLISENLFGPRVDATLGRKPGK